MGEGEKGEEEIMFGHDWDEDYRKPWPDIPPPDGDYGWSFRVSMKPVAVNYQKSAEILRNTMTRIKAQLFMDAICK
ncbi:MAG TPA: hypothetical protein ENH82_17860 [bacterium]|nr:hypothetical protein [bacterium]